MKFNTPNEIDTVLSVQKLQPRVAFVQKNTNDIATLSDFFDKLQATIMLVMANANINSTGTVAQIDHTEKTTVTGNNTTISNNKQQCIADTING